MDFGYIINRSFSIAWNYKSLWVLGLFAGSSTEFNFHFRGGNPLDQLLGRFNWEEELPFEIPDIDFSPEFIGSLVLAFLMIIGIMIAIHLITYPALIDGTNRIERGGVFSLGASFSRGIDFFWRYFGMLVIEIATIFAVIIALGILIAITAIGGPLVILGILIALPLGLAAAVIFTTIFSLAERALIVRDTTIGDAISEGIFLFRRNFGDCVLMWLIYIALAIGLGIALVGGAMLLYWPINSFVENLVFGDAQVLVLAFILGLPIALALGGFGGTFFTNLYTMFYFELVDPVAGRVAQAGPATTDPGTAPPLDTPGPR